jgi:hypothetical protein
MSESVHERFMSA